MKCFIAFWCNEGFEYVEDITKLHPDIVNMEIAQAILSGETAPTQPERKQSELGKRIHGMKMRGQFNSQRDYELYLFTAQETLTYDDVMQWVDSTPQDAVDWIRRNGSPLLKKFPRAETVIA